MSESGESKAVRPVSESQVENPYARSADSFKDPPKTFLGTLKHLGPGMILVGSIVGSGELIMTTKLGAEVGFLLLWFILASCFLKVVVQAELSMRSAVPGEVIFTIGGRLRGPRVGLSLQPHPTMVADSTMMVNSIRRMATLRYLWLGVQSSSHDSCALPISARLHGFLQQGSTPC